MLRPWEVQITLDLKGDKAIYLQIADAMIAAIKAGKLSPGEALPGSRKLATQMQVNRNTVTKALDVLLAEGWLETVARKGVFVAHIGKLEPVHSPTDLTVKNPVQSAPEKAPPIVFDDGFPDSRLAPTEALARAYRQIFNRKAKWQMMGYGDAQGDAAFRSAIAKMLNHKRGLNLNLDNLCITRGSQMALYLAASTLLEQGDIMAIENPGYRPAWSAFERAGAQLLPIAMEKDGLNVEQLRNHLQKGVRIKALYTTPHHQFPTTVSLSLSKRIALIELSNTYGFTIIEDDYDHEFHFGARPLLPIGSLQPIENYCYIGSLSKIVSPTLRIGYVASHTEQISKIVQLRKLIDVQGDSIMEQAVLELINDGSIRKHLSKAAQHYQKKRDAFDRLLQKHLKGKFTYQKPEGGLAFWLEPHQPIDLVRTVESLNGKGIQMLSPTFFSYDEPIAGLRLGYASLPEEQLKAGITQLAKLD